MRQLFYKILDIWYKIIRPFYVKDPDINEDYKCEFCNKPVLTRALYCSTECYLAEAIRDDNSI